MYLAAIYCNNGRILLRECDTLGKAQAYVAAAQRSAQFSKAQVFVARDTLDGLPFDYMQIS